MWSRSLCGSHISCDCCARRARVYIYIVRVVVNACSTHANSTLRLFLIASIDSRMVQLCVCFNDIYNTTSANIFDKNIPTVVVGTSYTSKVESHKNTPFFANDDSHSTT